MLFCDRGACSGVDNNWLRMYIRFNIIYYYAPESCAVISIITVCIWLSRLIWIFIGCRRRAHVVSHYHYCGLHLYATLKMTYDLSMEACICQNPIYSWISVKVDKCSFYFLCPESALSATSGAQASHFFTEM